MEGAKCQSFLRTELFAQSLCGIARRNYATAGAKSYGNELLEDAISKSQFGPVYGTR
jgi:hypothetical protein